MNMFKVKLFSQLAVIANSHEICIQSDKNKITQSDLFTLIQNQYPSLSKILKMSRLAINHQYADKTQIITSNDEIAVISPVSGG